MMHTGKGIFIVGVRKCGTTSLFDILANHSQISPCKHKEPQYYCLAPDAISEYRDWYRGLFKNTGKFLLDGSTLYYQNPESYNFIKQDFTTAKYILCLRDPAMRFYSAFWHMKAKAQRVEKRTLNEIIEALGSGTRQELLERENNLLNTAKKENKIDARYIDESYHYRDMMAPIKTRGVDPLVFYRYYSESVYSTNYNIYKKQPEGTVVIFEKLLNNPQVELEKIHRFIGLEVEPSTSGLVDNNNKTLAGSSAFTRVIGRTPIFTIVKSVFGSNLKYRIKKVFYKPIPVISHEEYKKLRTLLNEEYEYWFAIYPELRELWKFKTK